MAKKLVPFSASPKRINAFSRILSDASEEQENGDLDFLEDKAVDLSFAEEKEIDIEGMVDAALKQQALVPRDLKFDDSSMPRAKNFLEWLISPNFLKVSPYLEQALIGIRLFSEYCPRCSPNPAWLLTENHEPQEGIGAIKKHIVLLEHNKCPKCKVGRAELMRNGELNFYNELAVNAGQRCVVGYTPVVTAQGLVPISHLVMGHTVPGFHKAPHNVYAHSGAKLQPIKQVYVADAEPTYELTLENGLRLTGTADHPVRTRRGFTRLSDIGLDDQCQIVLGTNCWGRLLNPTCLIEAARSAKKVALEYIRDLCHDDGQELIFRGPEDDAQLVAAVWMNAGYMPTISRDDFTSVRIPSKCAPVSQSVFLPVSSIEDGESVETYDLCMDGLPQFVASGMVQHNSGKSIVVAMISTYQTHIILKSQNPCGILGIDQATTLHGTFVALTQKQASDTLWSPFFNYVMASPWFQRYHALIKSQERRYGQEVMKIRDTFIMYGHRNLVIYPAGPDGRVLRGRARILGALDEIAYFDNDPDSKKVKVSATLVYGALDRSMATARAAEQRLLAADYDDAFTAIMMNVSSPLHARDKINELMRQAQGSKSLLGIHAPTWKMNPTMPRNCQFIAEAFRKNPVEAMRDYGAEAPLSANPFLTQITYIENCVREKGRNKCVYNHHILKHKDGTRQRYGKLVKAPESSRASVLALDAGYTNNSFAMVIGSRDDAGVIDVDCLIEIMPKPGIPLNYTMIFNDLVIPICKLRNVRVMMADQWNSIKLLQDAKLSIPGMEAADKYSLKYSDLWAVKTLIECEYPRLTLPRLTSGISVRDTLDYDQDEYPACFEGRPVEHLLMQMQTVQDTGHSVIKNQGATDDLWRAMALMIYAFECGEYDEYLAHSAPLSINRDPNRLAVLGGRKDIGSAGSGRAQPGRIALGVAKGRLVRK